MQPGHDNPYQRPASDVVEEHLAGTLVDAGRWRRFFNWLVDYVAIIGLVFVATIVAFIVGGAGVAEWIGGMGFWQQQMVGIGAFLAYYTVMEGMFGLTIGKLITRTRVVNEAGAPPGWRAATLRSLARLIPFEPFSLLFSDDGAVRGWHDRLPRTRVVLRKAKPASAQGAGIAA